ncbi:MAG: sirohydrochlorin cobaltochelatase [Clostridia bacterium]|nr:sirohydrochlorin cobaltochelatase [Clostridia bacterium]
MKKGIIIVSFGTSYKETMEKCIESIERKVAERFNDYKVVRAFTSNFIIKKLKERDGIQVYTIEEAMAAMKAEGIDTIYVQPLHMIAGFEYEKVSHAVALARHDKNMTIHLGWPLLNEEVDYERLIEAIKIRLPKTSEREGVILMGHGTTHFANACYSMLQAKFFDVDKNIFIANVEGYPELEHVLDKIKGYEKLTLMPLMLVAGDHAQNDMAGDDEDSYKVILESEGKTVNCILEGLGENSAVQDIFLKRIGALINE